IALQNHVGNPMAMHFRYFTKHLPLVKNDTKFPLDISCEATLLYNPLSKTFLRSTSNISPSEPPMKYAIVQLPASSTVSCATTAPSSPKPATIDVAMARSSFGIDSATRVIPAPSSPASPMPAINRSIAYTAVLFSTGNCGRNPQAILASEYTIIEPNNTESRPRLSPKTPHRIPPSSRPVI